MRSTDDQAAAIAAELATDLVPPKMIFARHGIPDAEAKLLLKDPTFRSQVRRFKKDWEGAGNATTRIRLKAQLAVEDGVALLYNLFRDVDTAANARIDAYKQLVVLADAAPSKVAGAEVGSRFSVTINIPGAAPIAIDAPANPVIEHGDATTVEAP